MEKRKSFKYVKVLPDDEYFVSMIEYAGTLFTCTNKAMYQLVDECMVKVNIEVEVSDKEIDVLLRINGKPFNHVVGEQVKRVVIVGDKLINIIT